MVSMHTFRPLLIERVNFISHEIPGYYLSICLLVRYILFLLTVFPKAISREKAVYFKRFLKLKCAEIMGIQKNWSVCLISLKGPYMLNTATTFLWTSRKSRDTWDYPGISLVRVTGYTYSIDPRIGIWASSVWLGVSLVWGQGLDCPSIPGYNYSGGSVLYSQSPSLGASRNIACSLDVLGRLLL